MKGGNEALLNSHKLNLPVRLARFIGKEVEESYTGRMYIYDGLYVSHGFGTCPSALQKRMLLQIGDQLVVCAGREIGQGRQRHARVQRY